MSQQINIIKKRKCFLSNKNTQHEKELLFMLTQCIILNTSYWKSPKINMNILGENFSSTGKYFLPVENISLWVKY